MTTSTSDAPESQIARSETVLEVVIDQHRNDAERKQRRQHEHAPCGRGSRPGSPAQRPPGGRDRHCPDEPQSVGPRPGRVADRRLLVKVDAVGERHHRQAATEQSPAAVGAPSAQGDGRHDERREQEVAERVGEVDGDRRRVPLGAALKAG